MAQPVPDNLAPTPAENLIPGPNGAPPRVALHRSRTCTHYVYDAWNRLAKVYLDDGDSSAALDANDTLRGTYRYDGLHRRVRRIVLEDDGNSVPYDYFHTRSWQVIEVRRYNDTVAHKQYVWDVRYIDAPVCRFHDADNDGQFEPDANEHHYYTQGANFNVTALVDANSGAVVERYLYSPYGRRTVLDGNTDAEPWATEWLPDGDGISDYGNELGHQGLRQDRETWMYQVRTRYLNALLGRWGQWDKAGYVDGLGLYTSGRANWLRFVDPSGLKIKCKCDISKYLEGNGVTGFDDGSMTGAMGGYFIYSETAGLKNTGGALASEILFAMIKSDTMFLLKAKPSELANLKKHVAVREAVVKKAREAAFQWGHTKYNGQKWAFRRGTRYIVPKGSPHGAVMDIFTKAGAKKYAFGCAEAAFAVVAGGIADVFGQAEYDKVVEAEAAGGNEGPRPLTLDMMGGTFLSRDSGVGAGDWIPGDLAYVDNPVPAPDPYEGQWVVYFGNGKYWGHSGKKFILTWEEVQKKIAAWPSQDKRNPVDPASVKEPSSRDRPNVGLDTGSPEGQGSR